MQLQRVTPEGLIAECVKSKRVAPSLDFRRRILYGILIDHFRLLVILLPRTADREGRRRDPQDPPRNHQPLCWSQHLGPPRAAALSRQQSRRAAYRERPADTARPKRSYILRR